MSAALRLRLNELSGALLDLVAVNAGTAEVEEEILSLQARLAEIDGAQRKNEQAGEFLQEIFAMAERVNDIPIAWDEKEIRQMVECVKVVSSEKLLVIFRGGAMEWEVGMG